MAPRPSFDTWIQAARPVNPERSDYQLSNYYREKYGAGPNEDDFQAWAGRARAAVPDQDLADDDLRGVYSRRYGDIEKVSDVGRALSDAWSEAKGLAGGVAALAGDTVGSDRLRDYGLDVYRRNMGDVAGRHRQQYDFDYLREQGTAGDYIDAVQYHATKGVTSLIGGLGAGLVGRAVAKQAIKRGLKETLKEGFEEAAQESLSRAGRRGFVGGIGAYSVGQELGQIYPEAYAEAERTGQDVDLAKVYGYGTAAGAVEGLGDVALLGLAGLGRALPAGLRLGGITEGSRLARAGKLTAASAATEGLEEGVQNPLEYLGANKELGTDEFWAEQRQSVFAGALGGLGGAGLVVPMNLLVNPRQLPELDPDTTPEAEPGLQLPDGTFVPASGTPLQEALAERLGLDRQAVERTEKQQQQAERDYASAFEAAYNEPSGVITVDRQTQEERELTVGELLERQARGEQAPGGLDITRQLRGATPLQTVLAERLGLDRQPVPRTETQRRKAERDYAAAFEEAYNEPSGVRYTDPQTQEEVELTVGELAARQAELATRGETIASSPDYSGQIRRGRPIQEAIDSQEQLLGLNLDRPRTTPQQYAKEFRALYDAPSGEVVTDKETGLERELSVGESLERQATGRVPPKAVPAPTPQVPPKPAPLSAVERINEITGVSQQLNREQSRGKNRGKAISDVLNAPSGEYTVDPETQQEIELTAGDALHRRLFGFLPEPQLTTEEEILDSLSDDGKKSAVNARNPNTPIKAVRDLYAQLQGLRVDTPEARVETLKFFTDYDATANRKRGKSAHAMDELVLNAKRRLGFEDIPGAPVTEAPAAKPRKAKVKLRGNKSKTITTAETAQPEMETDEEVSDAFVSLAHELLNNTTNLTPEENAALRLTFSMEVPGVQMPERARGGKGDFKGGFSYAAVANAMAEAGLIPKPGNPSAAGSKLVLAGVAKLRKANPGTEDILRTYVQQAQALRGEPSTTESLAEELEGTQLSAEVEDTGDSALDTNVSEGQTYSIVKGTSGISLSTSRDAEAASALTTDTKLQAHVAKTAKVAKAAEEAFVAQRGAAKLQEVELTPEEQEAQSLVERQEKAMQEARAQANADLLNRRETQGKLLWSKAVPSVTWEDLVASEQDGILAFVAELETYPESARGAALAAAVQHMRTEYEAGSIRTKSAGRQSDDADSESVRGDADQTVEPVAEEQPYYQFSQPVQDADAGLPATPRTRTKVITRKRRSIQKGHTIVPGGSTTTREAFNGVVKSAIGRKSNWRIKVYDTAEEAIADGQPAERLRGTADAESTYGWVENKGGVRAATFILSRIGAGQELATFMHEVGAHIGLETVLKPAQRQRMVQQIRQWGQLNNNSREARIAARALERVRAAQTPEAQADAEILAYFAEEAVADGIKPTQMQAEKGALARLINNLWQAFQRALVKLGIKPDVIGPQEFVDMALGAARVELERQVTSAQSPATDEVSVSPAEAAAMLRQQPDRRQQAEARQGTAERRKGDRRTDDARRAKIAAMSVEEQYKLIYLNELTGLNNRRAFEEDVENVKVVASLDVDSLKTVNDNLGQDAGDALLRTVADVLDEATGGKAYHISGDEFYVLGDDAAEIEAGLKEAQELLATMSVKSEKGVLDGLSFSYGISTQKAKADTAMKAHKLEREARGERAGRGEIPAGMTFSQQTETLFGKAANPSVEDVSSSKVKEAINRVPPEYRPAVTAITDTIRSAAQKTYLGLAFLKDLGDVVSSKVPALEKHVKQFMESINATKVDRVRSEKRLTQVLDRYQQMDVADRKKVNDYLAASRLQREWGYEPSWLPGVTVNQAMKARFDRLPQAAQDTVKDVNRIMWENLQTKQRLITQRIQETFDARVKAATDPAAVAQINQERELALKAFGKKLIAIEGPYSPLKRHGRYVVQAYSEEMAAARQAKDYTRIEELRRDPKHYALEFAESRIEAEKRKAALRAEFSFTDSWEKAQWRENPVVGLHEVDRLRSYIAGQVENETSERSRQLLNMAEDLALRVMSEEHARQTAQYSKDIRGFDRDMMRAFITQGRADAHYIANLKHLSNTNDAVNQIAGFVENPEQRDSSGVSRDELTRLANALYWHWGKSMDYRETPLLDRLSAASSAWYLLFSPAYYLQNLTQVGMMSMPYMAGRFGWSNTARELGRAYADIKDMVTSAGAFEHFDTSKVPEDVRVVVEQLLDSGAINITMDLELGQVAQTGEGAISQAQQVFDRTVRRLPAKVETINRVVTGIAAYRLGRDYPDAKYSSKQMGHEHAINYAKKVIDITHGDYDGVNTPKFISPKFIPAAKVLFQFRKFQIIQLSYLARMFNDMIRGETPEVQAVARRQMAFTLGHFAALAGGLGLPGVAFMQSMVGVIGSMFGDDDEPWDSDAQVFRFRKAAASMGLPPEMVDILLHGMPTTLGMNLTSRLGAQNVASLMPYIRADVRDYDSYDKLLAGALGPAASLGKKVLWGGGGAMASGDYYKAAESVLPNGIRSSLTALRQATEGETTYNGDRVMTPEEIGLWQTMQTALGLSSKVSQERFAKQRTLQGYEGKFDQRASDLKRQYSEAKRDKDSARQKRLREEWRKLQQTKREAGFRPTPLSELMKAPYAQRRRELLVEGGVKYDLGNRRFVQELSRVYGD